MSSLIKPRRKMELRQSLLKLLSLDLVLFLLFSRVSGYSETVYIRSHLQLLSSDTLRWFKQGAAKEPLKLYRPNGESQVICRVWHSGLRGIGLVTEENLCNVPQEGDQHDLQAKYETLSTSASRLVWKPWQRPNPPPIGAIAVSPKPKMYLATDLNSTVIGFLDPQKNLGSGIFPNQEPVQSCLVLVEVPPERYELTHIQLKKLRGFVEETVVLAENMLQLAEENDVGSEDQNVESALTYEVNSLDNWGRGNLMVRGLPTSIWMDDGSTKAIEWGIASTKAGKTESKLAQTTLSPGTGVNVTLYGTKMEGEMSYWATLKTIFKDGSASSRLLEGHRRLNDVVDIRLEYSKPFYLGNFTIVPDPTTTTTTTSTSTTTTTTEEPPPPIDDETSDQDHSFGESDESDYSHHSHNSHKLSASSVSSANHLEMSLYLLIPCILTLSQSI